MQYPGKLLSKYESKIKAFLDLKILKTFSCFASFFGRLLENMIYQIKKFIEKERDMVWLTVDWLTNNFYNYFLMCFSGYI